VTARGPELPVANLASCRSDRERRTSACWTPWLPCC